MSDEPVRAQIGGRPDQDAKKLPTILVGWDEANQKVVLQFVSSQFKEFPFLKAVLQMAVGEVDQAWEQMKIMATMEGMRAVQHQAVAAQANEQNIRRQLQKGS
jgi:predicted TIM-barrel fold metal-dependent hydrolase